MTDKGSVHALYDNSTTLALHRIIKIETTRRSSVELPDVIEENKGAFGYIEDDIFTVCVKFSEDVSTYIAECQWSNDQQIEDHADGSISLTMTARSSLEVISWVLGFGADAELISPPWLREKVAETIEHLHKTYI